MFLSIRPGEDSRRTSRSCPSVDDDFAVCKADSSAWAASRSPETARAIATAPTIKEMMLQARRARSDSDRRDTSFSDQFQHFVLISIAASSKLISTNAGIGRKSQGARRSRIRLRAACLEHHFLDGRGRRDRPRRLRRNERAAEARNLLCTRRNRLLTDGHDLEVLSEFSPGPNRPNIIKFALKLERRDLPAVNISSSLNRDNHWQRRNFRRLWPAGHAGFRGERGV